ncbi:mast cell protease 2-like [Aphis craccivora]|uniref:Mast cell protease 2-like n=1 Tax=Aphis craccivora TaxID=307492 RepID=A0A6G0Y0M3_APHCR|nr:mast cell protease 2-like [Aphis craccivora]
MEGGFRGQDTPVKRVQKNKASSSGDGVGSKLSSNTSNEDLLKFAELKNNLKQVSSLITELKAKNSKLRNELETLKGKMIILKSTAFSIQSHEVVSQVMHEQFEQSTSSSIPERVTHDKSKVKEILGSLRDSITSSSKFIRLGKNRSDATCPRKIIFNTCALGAAQVKPARRSTRRYACVCARTVANTQLAVCSIVLSIL